MKKLFYRSQKTGAVAVIGLGLLTMSAVGLKNSETTEAEAATASLEVVEEFAFKEVSDKALLVDKRPGKIMFFDSTNELILETSPKDRNNPEVEVMIRRSDFLMEFEGVRYYHLNE